MIKGEIYKGKNFKTKLSLVMISVLLLFCHCRQFQQSPVINIWHGLHQKVGHLGVAQDDFNLMGIVSGKDSVVSLNYRLNQNKEIALSIGKGKYGFRRLAGEGHFNADIPINLLNFGTNEVKIKVTDIRDRSSSVTVIIDKKSGDYSLPVFIDWSEISDPQDVGQYVDGEWVIEENGLRTKHSGYDRIFLIGNKSWKDYEVTIPVTINDVEIPLPPRTFQNGLGILLRFSGHVDGGYRNFPEGQPKWGYHPFGGLGWLRWKKGKQDQAPRMQFYSGFSDEVVDDEDFHVRSGETIWIKMRCETLLKIPEGAVLYERVITCIDKTVKELPDNSSRSESITKYSFKTWKTGDEEPEEWNWQQTQVSRHALYKGALALLAFHVDATFGNIAVTPISKQQKKYYRYEVSN